MNKLKELRESKGVSRIDLADKSGVGLEMIKKVEQQKSGIEVRKALKIAKALKINVLKIWSPTDFL